MLRRRWINAVGRLNPDARCADFGASIGLDPEPGTRLRDTSLTWPGNPAMGPLWTTVSLWWNFMMSSQFA